MNDQVPSPGFLVSNAETRASDLTSSKSNDIPATKQFVVNATGNLFIASTLNTDFQTGSVISQEAEEAFGQVSIFFAALTKSMEEAGVSFYDYSAINKIVSKSGLFVKVTESQIDFTSKKKGVVLGNQLIQTLLGLSGNLASIGKSITDMIAGMGQESIEISRDKKEQKKRVGTLIFVCEYLMGAISISPIIISVDAAQAESVWKAGPCLKAQSENFKLDINKAVYLFVPPAFVKHSATLNEAMSDPEFNNLVDNLKDYITED